MKFIVPFGPGAGVDIGARLVADRLPARWGKPVIVENRPGADGLVAIQAFVSADDDHVLLFSPSSAFTVHPFQYEKLPYTAADLAPAYPRFEEFRALRDRLDPDRVFANDYLRRVLGD